MKSLYDPFPKTKIKGYDNAIIQGWDEIIKTLNGKEEQALIVDTYPSL